MQLSVLYTEIGYETQIAVICRQNLSAKLVTILRRSVAMADG